LPPIPLGEPQIPYGLAWNRSRTSAVIERQLSSWAWARITRSGERQSLQNALMSVRRTPSVTT